MERHGFFGGIFLALSAENRDAAFAGKLSGG
jgi:hypothetical protein